MRNPALLVVFAACGLTHCAAETLQQAAGKRLLVGTAVAAADLRDPVLAGLVAKQFGGITPEYEFMPEKLVDEAGKFTFAQGDRGGLHHQGV